MFKLIVFFVLVHVTLLVPGFVVVRRLGPFRDRPGLELCAAYTVSMVGFAALALLRYILNVPPVFLRLTSWALLVTALLLFIRGALHREVLRQHRFPLTALVAMSAFACAYISLSYNGPRAFIPDPQPMEHRNYDAFNVKVLNVSRTPAIDNYIPYRQAQFFVNRTDPTNNFVAEWGVHFFQRTALMGAVTAGYFLVLGDALPVHHLWSADSIDPEHTYEKFQVLAHVLNSLLVLPAFFFLARLFDRRTAAATALFLVPNHYFLYNSYFSWPKSLVAFFVLFLWMLLYEGKGRRDVLFAGAVSGIAYLTHDLAVLYMGASFLLLLYLRRGRDALIVGAVTGLFVLPWMFLSSRVYHMTSLFVYYPISVDGIPQINGPADKARHVRRFLDTPVTTLLGIRAVSLLFLLSPYQFLYPGPGQSVLEQFWGCSISNIPGAAGLPLAVAMAAGSFRRLKDVPFWILTVMPLVLCTVVVGYPRGMGALHFAQASVVLFMGLGVWFLLGLRGKAWLPLAFLCNALHTALFIAQSHGFHVGAWLRRPTDLAALAVLFGIAGLCGWGMLREVGAAQPAPSAGEPAPPAPAAA